MLKANGKQRPLGIPALEDKLVQKAVAMILTAIYEQDFLDCSYGYRPGRGAKDAVSDLAFQLQFGVFGYIVEADVRGYFDNIDHDKLLSMMAQRINARAFMRLISKWLKAGILEPDGYVKHPVTGTPQGGIVSPVFKSLKSKLVGHYNYYYVRGNSRAVWSYYSEVIRYAKKWLDRRSQRKSYNWDQFKRVLEWTGIRRPRPTEKKRLHRCALG